MERTQSTRVERELMIRNSFLDSESKHSLEEVKVQEERSGQRLVTRTLDSNARYETCLRDTVKLERAHGGCLGVERRRRTWTAAKSSGEPRTGCDPEVPEWGNPRVEHARISRVNP